MRASKITCKIGDRIEVVWDDAHNYPDREECTITCFDLGYFGGVDKTGIRIWREIDEDGEFRFKMGIPLSVISSIKYLGSRPKVTKVKNLQVLET